MPQRTKPLKAGATLGRNPAAAQSPRTAPTIRTVAAVRRARDTGFTPAQKLLIRTRAGNGDPAQARCEATGVFLGEHGGEIQHIQARGMGGSRLRNNVANGVLLACAVHRLAEARDEHLHEQGFWRYSHEVPGPIMLHGQNGGVLAWLDDEGRYLDADGQIIGGAA
jgi:hypothetical protein